jgi:hypothetical protein
MADTEKTPATLLDELVALDRAQRCEVATELRKVAERPWPKCPTARQPHTCWVCSLTCSTCREPDGLCRKSGH